MTECPRIKAIDGILFPSWVAAAFSFINPTVEEILAESVNNWDVVAGLNSTQNTLEFKVTGEANKNILWLAHITLSEADYS